MAYNGEVAHGNQLNAHTHSHSHTQLPFKRWRLYGCMYCLYCKLPIGTNNMISSSVKASSSQVTSDEVPDKLQLFSLLKLVVQKNYSYFLFSIID